MQSIFRSPWFIVTLIILALIAGYTTVLAMRGDLTLNAYVCPADCQREGCHKTVECASGECSPGCPGNCHKGDA